MSEHIVPVRVYITIFLVLLVGTALTVAAAFVDFPWRLNTIVALTIATTFVSARRAFRTGSWPWFVAVILIWPLSYLYALAVNRAGYG